MKTTIETINEINGGIPKVDINNANNNTRMINKFISVHGESETLLPIPKL